MSGADMDETGAQEREIGDMLKEVAAGAALIPLVDP